MGQSRNLVNLPFSRPPAAAVFAACGWKPDLSDDDLLAALLALNQERAASPASPKAIS